MPPSSSSHTAAAVGTVQIRSLIEPLRKIIARLRGQMIVGKAVDLAMSERLLEVEILDSSGHQRIYVPFVFFFFVLLTREPYLSEGMTSLSSLVARFLAPMVYKAYSTASN